LDDSDEQYRRIEEMNSASANSDISLGAINCETRNFGLFKRYDTVLIVAEEIPV
jgi:hypothetical protein